ncbi:MAG: metallophosphatase [Bacteroidaceae bacterium]|nr:metallophosphatase [Bacteroidaceae bacterium]
MKRLLYLLILLPIVPLTLSAQADKYITILHTSDMHSCIEPDGKTGLGGVVRRATFVEQMRKNKPNTLLVDCGDFSQGSLYYNLFKGETEVMMMNAMGYDVATIGNHEFDFGLDNMMRIFAMAEFPIVSTNYDFTGTPVEAFVRPYHIMKVDGVCVGFVGVGPQLEGLVAEANCKGVKYHDPIAAADSVAAILKEQERCDVVVCLSHLGWKTGNGVDDEHLIAGSRNIDLVLGGHTHSYFKEPLYYKNLDGRDIMLMHVGKNGQYVSETVIGLNKG